MNVNSPFFYDRRRLADTHLAEMIAGALSVSYGVQAIQDGSSQFNVLLSLQGRPMLFGAVLIFAGAASLLFAYTQAYKARFAIALLLFFVWAAIVLMFCAAELAGPPLYNGLILMAAATRVMIGSLQHEKQLRRSVL